MIIIIIIITIEIRVRHEARTQCSNSCCVQASKQVHYFPWFRVEHYQSRIEWVVLDRCPLARTVGACANQFNSSPSIQNEATFQQSEHCLGNGNWTLNWKSLRNPLTSFCQPLLRCHRSQFKMVNTSKRAIPGRGWNTKFKLIPFNQTTTIQRRWDGSWTCRLLLHSHHYEQKGWSGLWEHALQWIFMSDNPQGQLLIRLKGLTDTKS